MATPSRSVTRIELLQGTLDLVILQTLRWGPRHGYGITQMIRAQSRDVLQVDTGSLYPALHRLERKGWIAAEWGITENSRRAKYYELTRAGRAQLKREIASWTRFSAAVWKVVSATEQGA